jgi:hypothetical protein
LFSSPEYREKLLEDFNTALSRLLGTECVSVEITPGKFGSIRFRFGNMLAVERDEWRGFGDYALEVWCLWRLERLDSVIGSFVGNRGETQTINQALDYMRQQRIKSVELTPPSFDLKLEFAQQIYLHVLCGGMGHQETNYVFDDFVGKEKWAKPLGYILRENGNLDYRPELPEE